MGLGARPERPEFEHHRLEALWTYQALDVPEPSVAGERCFDSKDRARTGGGDARRAVLENAAGRSAVAPGRARQRRGTRVFGSRRSAALAQIPSLASAELASRALDRPVDYVPRLRTLADGPPARPVWLPEVQAGRFDFGGRADASDFRACGRGFACDRQAAAGFAQGGKSSHRATTKRSDPDCPAGRTGRSGRGTRSRDRRQTPCPAPRRVSLLNTLVRATRDARSSRRRPGADRHASCRLATMRCAKPPSARSGRGRSRRSRTSSSSWRRRRIHHEPCPRRRDRGTGRATVGPRGAGSVESSDRKQGRRRRSRRGSWPPCWKPIPKGPRRVWWPGSAGSRLIRRMPPRSCWLASSSGEAPGACWHAASTMRAPSVRRPGQAVYPPGSRLGPRRARADRRLGESRPAQGRRRGSCRTRR